MPKSRAKRKSPPPKHKPSALPTKLPKTSPDVPLTAVLMDQDAPDTPATPATSGLDSTAAPAAAAVSEKRLTFFLPDALFLKLSRFSGHSRITNADNAEKGRVEETGAYPDSPSAICREALVYFLDTVLAPEGAEAIKSERKKAMFWEKRIAALRRCANGGRLLAILLCIAVATLFMCGCNNNDNAPRSVNVGRFEVEDCGYVNPHSSRRVYVLTDRQTNRTFLAVTDCGLLEITPQPQSAPLAPSAPIVPHPHGNQ